MIGDGVEADAIVDGERGEVARGVCNGHSANVEDMREACAQRGRLVVDPCLDQAPGVVHGGLIVANGLAGVGGFHPGHHGAGVELDRDKCVRQRPPRLIFRGGPEGIGACLLHGRFAIVASLHGGCLCGRQGLVWPADG